jgi:hypothetical protein
MHTKPNQLGQYTLSLFLFIIIVLFSFFSYLSLSYIRDRSLVSLNGTILTSSGTKIAGAQLRILGSNTVSDSNGNYLLSNIPSGWNKLYTQAVGYGSIEQELFAPFGTDSTINIVWPSVDRASIQGRVVVLENEVDAKRMIVKANTVTIPVNNKGNFMVDNLEPQKISLLVSFEGYEDYYSTINLQTGINEIGDIVMVRLKEPVKLLIKGKNPNIPLYNTKLIFNGTEVRSDNYGMVSLKNAGFVNGDNLKIQVNGFEEKTVIYDETKEILDITVDLLAIEK